MRLSAAAGSTRREKEGPAGRGVDVVTLLSRAEHASLLPVSATGLQYAYYFGSLDAALQRFAASLLGGLLSCSAPLFAVPAGLYWLWAPLLLAARRSAPLRRYACAGIWHARVLEAESSGSCVFDAHGDAFVARRRAGAVTRLLLGDDSGARVELEVPLQPEHRAVRPGTAAELLVLSEEPGLRRFFAVRETYLPELGLWISEYPFIQRRIFEDISTAICAGA